MITLILMEISVLAHAVFLVQRNSTLFYKEAMGKSLDLVNLLMAE